MVATAAGARDFARAERAAWTGAAVAAAIGLVFTVVALFGRQWMGLFTSDPAIRDMGALYLLEPGRSVPADRRRSCLLLRRASASASSASPLPLAALRLVLIVGGAWLASGAHRQRGCWPSPTVAVGIASFALGLLAVMRTKFSRLRTP